MLNRMLKQQLKLNTHEAGVVHGKEAPVWGAVTVQRELLKENLCLLLLVRKSLDRATQGKHQTYKLRSSLEE